MTPKNTTSNARRPLVAITSDLMIRNDRPTAYLTSTYAQAVHNAGGIPVILPPIPPIPPTPPTPPTPQIIADLITRFDAFILSGGDDPKTEPFGTPSHPAITPVLASRQEFETQLIAQLNNSPQTPVLGICLGMQMLALCNAGKLNQHLPDTHDSHPIHWNHAHQITSSTPALPSGTVWSKHRQAVSDPGSMEPIATAPDGIIEAIINPKSKFCLGVQWHPERTDFDPLGLDLFKQLIAAIDS